MVLKEIEKNYDAIYAIYEEAFPKNERRTREGQLEAMKNPYYRLLVRKEAEKINAFLGWWALSSCCFIEHLATVDTCRGKGYGKELVLECLEMADKPVFLEIEPVTDENPMTKRRAGFYERLGFCCNHFPYEQMPLKAGDEPAPLWVMSYGKPMTEEEFRPYKKEIYREVYKVR